MMEIVLYNRLEFLEKIREHVLAIIDILGRLSWNDLQQKEIDNLAELERRLAETQEELKKMGSPPTRF